jgi:hypothetical protein
MPEIVADPPPPPCYLLIPRSGIEEYQWFAPDPLLLARTAVISSLLRRAERLLQVAASNTRTFPTRW